MYPSNGSHGSVYSGSAQKQTRDFFPGSVQGNTLRPVKITSSSITLSSSIANNTYTVFQVGRSTSARNVVIAQPNISVFVGGLDPVLNLHPGGTGFNNSQYEMFGPIHVSYLLNGNSVDTGSIESRIYISNASGGTTTVTVVVTYSYIANGGDIFS